MGQPEMPPVGVPLSADVEYREDRRQPYRARVRWVDPATKRRRSRSESFGTSEAAQDWIDAMQGAARGGVDPVAATMTLAEYGDAVMSLAVRGLEAKTLDPYLAGWRKRVTERAECIGDQPCDVRSLGFEFGGQIRAFRIETGQLGELRLGIAAELGTVQRLAPGGLGRLAEPGHDRYRRGPRRGVSIRREGKQLPLSLLLAARVRP